MENWLNEFEHPTLNTPELQEQAKQTLGKFSSKDDAIVGYLELQKQAGRPFKLPKSIDSIPDEKDRTEFVSGVGKLLGIMEKEDAIPEDFNWAEGLPEGAQRDENLIASLKKHIVGNNWTLNQLKALVGWANGYAVNYHQQIKQNAINEINETNKKLLEIYNGSEENLKNDIELMRRTFKNQEGMTADEYEQIAEDLMSPDENGKVGAILRKPILAKWMLKILAPKSKEGTGEKGEGSETIKKETKDPDEGTPSYKALGWSK